MALRLPEASTASSLLDTENMAASAQGETTGLLCLAWAQYSARTHGPPLL